MSRRFITAALTCAAIGVLGACAGDEEPNKPTIDPTSSATPDQDEAAIDAFDSFYGERTSLMNTEGRPPSDALTSTVAGPYREEQVAELTRSSSQWQSREGEPLITGQKATVDGDTAVVLACFNEDEWSIITLEGQKVSPGQGWQSIGNTLTRSGGTWLVNGPVPEGQQLTCP